MQLHKKNTLEQVPNLQTRGGFCFDTLNEEGKKANVKSSNARHKTRTHIQGVWFNFL